MLILKGLTDIEHKKNLVTRKAVKKDGSCIVVRRLAILEPAIVVGQGMTKKCYINHPLPTGDSNREPCNDHAEI